MKVLIVNNMAPFVWGGAEELAVHLQKNLVICGHEAEILRIPFQWNPATRISSQMLMVRSFELTNVDRVIALKFPAYLIRHPKKTLWLLHQYRQAYDLLDAGQTNISDDKEGRGLRSLIQNADRESFLESRNIFVNSEVIKKRLLMYNGFDCEVLPSPVRDAELFSGGEASDYIFAAGRINSMKRQHLLLEALGKADKKVKLLIAGPPDTPDDAKRLEITVERLRIKDRVRLDLRFLPRQVYADYLNQSMAVACLPYDEDSLSYVGMEASNAAKALITTTDSGGILGLVKHEETGWIVPPTADDLAMAMSEVYKNPSVTEKKGKAARALWNSMNINWIETVEKLLK